MTDTTDTTTLAATLSALAHLSVDIDALVSEWGATGLPIAGVEVMMAPMFDDGTPNFTNCGHDELSPYGTNMAPGVVRALLRKGLATALRFALSAPAETGGVALAAVWAALGEQPGDHIIAGLNADPGDGTAPWMIYASAEVAALLLEAADTTPDADAALAELTANGPSTTWAQAVETAAAAEYGRWSALKTCGLYEPIVQHVSFDQYRACLVSANEFDGDSHDAERWTRRGVMVTGVARRLHAAMATLRGRSSVGVELTEIERRSSGFGDRDHDYSLTVWSDRAQCGTARSVSVEGTYTIHTTCGGAVEFGPVIADPNRDKPMLTLHTTSADGLGMTEFVVPQRVLDDLGLDRIIRDALVKERLDVDFAPSAVEAGDVLSLTPDGWADELAAALGSGLRLCADLMLVTAEDGTFTASVDQVWGNPSVIKGPDFDVLPGATFAAYLEPESLTSFDALKAEIADLSWSSITAVFRELES